MKCPLLYTLLAVLLLLTSCGTESGRFRLEGRLRNLNQGEFWVYSADGAFEGIDTIPVRDGRFSYEMSLYDVSTLVVIFPNYSEQPVFAESGATVTIKGDATHLKEMTIEGTDENEHMTQLRMELNRSMPPEVPQVVQRFIEKYPDSEAAIYLLQRYFICTSEPNYQQARRLVRLMLKANPDNGRLMKLDKQLATLQGAPMRGRLPKFEATDVDGRKVTESALKGRVGVVTTWAAWSYHSIGVQNRLNQLKKKYGDRLGVVSICLEGRPDDCRKRIKGDSLQWSTVCDGRVWHTPLLSKFALADVPGNVLFDKKGVVVARNLTGQELEDRIKNLLK
ncbi:MAG: AhpC/TSA family protein [Prevotella sp.]|nr:AhpC/TSA family protein [Prevotella sp.]